MFFYKSFECWYNFARCIFGYQTNANCIHNWVLRGAEWQKGTESGIRNLGWRTLLHACFITLIEIIPQLYWTYLSAIRQCTSPPVPPLSHFVCGQRSLTLETWIEKSIRLRIRHVARKGTGSLKACLSQQFSIVSCYQLYWLYYNY